MLIFDSAYILMVFIPSLVLSLLAQLFVRSAYSKWGKTRNSLGLSGVEVGERIRRASGMTHVGFEAAQGELTDHYDPSSNVVRLSRDIATKPSVASMAIVAHELGHAQQHAQNSVLIGMRNFLVPAMQFSPMISYGLIFAGLIFRIMDLAWLGIGFFTVVVAFMLLTLPVEFDASRRGLILLREAGLMVDSQDAGGSRQMLTAAALTYVAAFITALLTLLYYISLVQRRS
jgi:Zn-dependent membrane protease YugP